MITRKGNAKQETQQLSDILLELIGHSLTISKEEDLSPEARKAAREISKASKRALRMISAKDPEKNNGGWDGLIRITLTSILSSLMKLGIDVIDIEQSLDNVSLENMASIFKNLFSK